MKYIVFKKFQSYHPVIFADHTTHAEIKMKGGQEVSAGFFRLGIANTIKTFGESESLKLKPHARDARLLEKVLWGEGTAAFLDYINE